MALLQESKVSVELHSRDLILGISEVVSRYPYWTCNSDLMVSTSELGSGNPGRENKRPRCQMKFQNKVSYDHKLQNYK